MNCKPGDLAYITRQPYLGHFVRVLRWSPPGKDMLPDGYPANNMDGGGWMCEKANGKFLAPIVGGGRRATPFAVIQDCYLRLIRPGDVTDEEVRGLYAPKIPEAA